MLCCIVPQFVAVRCSVDCVLGFLYVEFPSRQITDASDYNGLRNTVPGIPRGDKLHFLMNLSIIWTTMMDEYAANYIEGNVCSHNVLSSLILQKH